MSRLPFPPDPTATSSKRLRVDLRWVIQLGRHLVTRAWTGRLAGLPDPMGWGEVMLTADQLAEGPVDLRDALAVVMEWRRGTSDLDERSLRVEIEEMARMVSHIRALGAWTLDMVETVHCQRAVESAGHRRNGDRIRPSANSKHNRLAALRVFTRGCRALGLRPSTWDPTADVLVPQRSRRDVTIFDDASMSRCWATAEAGLLHNRRPALLAAVEAGASPGELPKIEIGHVDLDDGTISLLGTRNIRARTNHLSPRAVWAIRNRLTQLDPHRQDAPLLVDPETGTSSAGASLNRDLVRVLTDAGLRGPGVGYRSVHAWAALTVYRDPPEGQDRVAAVADFLGYTSLDSAARLIGIAWSRLDPAAT